MARTVAPVEGGKSATRPEAQSSHFLPFRPDAARRSVRHPRQAGGVHERTFAGYTRNVCCRDPDTRSSRSGSGPSQTFSRTSLLPGSGHLRLTQLWAAREGERLRVVDLEAIQAERMRELFGQLGGLCRRWRCLKPLRQALNSLGRARQHVVGDRQRKSDVVCRLGAKRCSRHDSDLFLVQ